MVTNWWFDHRAIDDKLIYQIDDEIGHYIIKFDQIDDQNSEIDYLITKLITRNPNKKYGYENDVLTTNLLTCWPYGWWYYKDYY